MKTVSVGSLAVRLGRIIVLPLLVCVPLGVVIDRAVGSLPLVTLTSLILAAGISTVLVVRVVQNDSDQEIAS